MRVPQEIVDEVIDYFGVPLDQPQSHDPIFYRWDLDKTILNSLALVSKACNDRVRYYLFSHCNIMATPSDLRTFARCPDILLTYTRFLYICRPRNIGELQSVVSRFSSSPLIRVRFISAPILAPFSAMFRSFLPTVRCVQFEKCIFDPIAVVRLREHPNLSEMSVGGCVASGILESVEDIRAGIPRRVPDGSGSVKEITARVLRSLRALRLESNGDQVENELVGACAKSLQFIEIKAMKDWAPSAFCLDLGSCSKLRTIAFEAAQTETSIIRNLVELLSTLKAPQNLWKIRVSTGGLHPIDSDAGSSQLEVWRRLDKLLCGLFIHRIPKEDDVGITFQVASRKTATPLIPHDRLLEMLPKFRWVGTCEEVRV